jgi:hypothetical protein
LNIPESKRGPGGWSAVAYADVHDFRHLQALPSIHDSRGDSPRQPRQMYAPFQPASLGLIPPISLPMPPINPNPILNIQSTVYSTSDVFY